MHSWSLRLKKYRLDRWVRSRQHRHLALQHRLLLRVRYLRLVLSVQSDLWDLSGLLRQLPLSDLYLLYHLSDRCLRLLPLGRYLLYHLLDRYPQSRLLDLSGQYPRLVLWVLSVL